MFLRLPETTCLKSSLSRVVECWVFEKTCSFSALYCVRVCSDPTIEPTALSPEYPQLLHPQSERFWLGAALSQLELAEACAQHFQESNHIHVVNLQQPKPRNPDSLSPKPQNIFPQILQQCKPKTLFPLKPNSPKPQAHTVIGRVRLKGEQVWACTTVGFWGRCFEVLGLHCLG